MAITNYAELKTAGANWSGRTDLTSRIPEFISLVEAKMNRRLREKNMVTKDAAFSINAEYVAVPASFGGVKTFYITTSDDTVLELMPDHLITFKYQGTTGRPRHYNVQGSNFRFGPPPDTTYTATLVYYLLVPALSDSATTNWMITNHPDAYVYGLMGELEAYVQNEAAAQSWFARMYSVIDEIKRASSRDTYGGDAALAARPG